MTDLDAFKQLLRNTDHDQVTDMSELCDYTPDSDATTVIVVHAGCRAHFEAAFDKHGALLEIGQFQCL